MNEWWRYDNLPSGAPYDWGLSGDGESRIPAERGDSPYDQIDFHLDLGCGSVPKGRLGIDRRSAPEVDIVLDLETFRLGGLGDTHRALKTDDEISQMVADLDQDHLLRGLPFPDNSIRSIISHHCLEHIGSNFIKLIDECHRVLEPDGILRAITPLFPSHAAVADPDHKRYFMVGTWQTFCGAPSGEHWMEAFSVPYTQSRFELMEEMWSPPTEAGMFEPGDSRELRVALRKRP